jgi:hypothetical protein
MPRRIYPFSYLAVVGLLLGLSLLLVGFLSPGRPRASQLPFFLLGAGFMLVETKSITELGLTFGNTWQVIGVVILGVLLMAFLANAAVGRLGIRQLAIPYVLLLASLVVGWASGGFPSTTAGRAAALLILTCPLFFSGLVFSTLLQYAEDLSSAMAANLVGAIFGGFLEYNSMYFGFKSLYIAAFVIYGLAFLTSSGLIVGSKGRRESLTSTVTS